MCIFFISDTVFMHKNLSQISSVFPVSLSSTFLNIQNIIIVLLFLGLFPLIDFYPHYGSYFTVSFACLLTFYCMWGIVEFYLPVCWYFCIPLNILEFCPGMQLSNLSMVWSFWDLLKTLISLELILSLHTEIISSEYVTISDALLTHMHWVNLS